MKPFLRRLFLLVPGEGRKALSFGFLGFLWAFGASLSEKLAEALFLLHVGASSLPEVYIITALCLFLSGAVLLGLSGYYSPTLILLGVLGFALTAFSLLFLGLSSGVLGSQIWLFYAMMTVTYGLIIIFTTTFWTFTDQFHDEKSATRAYPIYAACIFLGVTVAGSILGTGGFSLKSLILIVACLYLAATLWVYRLALRYRNKSLHLAEGGHLPILSLLKGILTSRFTLLLLATGLLKELLGFTMEFHYMSAFEQAFDPASDLMLGLDTEAQLTTFLGQCTAWMTVGNLLFSMFVYNRVLKAIGLGNAILILPILFCIGFLGWPLGGSGLFFPIVGFVVTEGLLYTIGDTNFSLMMRGVPSPLQYRVRVCIESFFEPAGLMLSGFLLMSPGLSTIWVASIIAALSLALSIYQKNGMRLAFSYLR